MLPENKTIKLDSSQYDVSKITIGLGWNIREKETSFWDRFFFDEEEDFDLDAIAFLLDKNDRIMDLGEDLSLTGKRRVPFQKSDIIYFHNLTAPSGNLGAYHDCSPKKIEKIISNFLKNGEYIIHTGDNLVGASDEDSDAEQIIVDIKNLPLRIHKILFLVCIYKGKERDQHFGLVENAYIRTLDAKGNEMAKFEFSKVEEFENKCSMTFGELYRTEEGWSFRTNIHAYETDNFVEILKKYTKSTVVHI